MAFRKRPGSTSSTLEQDLQISSSEEDDEFVLMQENEDDMLRDDDEVEGATATGNSTVQSNLQQQRKTPFFVDAQATTSKNQNEKAPKTGNNEEAMIEYDHSFPKVLSLKDNSTENAPKTAGALWGELHFDKPLDEVVEERNIHAPPKGPRHRFFYERPVTGAWGKMHNPELRRNMSLDEIIKQDTAGKFNKTIRRRNNWVAGENTDMDVDDVDNKNEKEKEEMDGNRSGNRRQQQQPPQKFKRGVRTITENRPDHGKEVLHEAFQAPEEFKAMGSQVSTCPPDPWNCINALTNKGYCIYWSVSKRKNSDYVTGPERNRLYRCVVQYKEVKGVAEAESEIVAKHGAAVDFMKKLLVQFPSLTMAFDNQIMKVDDGLLLDSTIMKTAISALKEKLGDFRYLITPSTQTVNNRTLHMCTLSFNSSTYKGYSYVGAKCAKFQAVKAAYEDNMKELCPMKKVYMGPECTDGDESLFQGVQSQMVHCCDFSRVKIVDHENLRTSLANARRGITVHGNSYNIPRPSKAVYVSYMGPNNMPVPDGV